MKQSNKVREIVNCLCLNKQLWFKVQVKTAPPCDSLIKDFFLIYKIKKGKALKRGLSSAMQY